MILLTYFPLYVEYNHGLALLSRQCKDAGIPVKTVPIGKNFWQYIEQAEMVCFSAVTKHDYEVCRSVARQINKPRILGGVYPRSGAPISDFDFVCHGEADKGFVGFIKSGDTIIFDKPQLFDNIDTLPDYSGVTGYEFHRGLSYLVGKKIMPYSSSRGCPYDCSFCMTMYQPKKTRIKKSINDDLTYLKKFNPDLILFTDELLPYYSDSWCDQMKETPFVAYIRADIEPDRLKFLIDKGLYACAFGIESGDEKYRNDVLNKDLYDEDIYRTVNTLKKHDVIYSPFYMFNTKNETEKTKKATMDMAEKVGGEYIIWEYETLWEPQQQ